MNDAWTGGERPGSSALVDESKTHWATIVAVTIAIAADGFDLAIMGYLLPYVEKTFGLSLGVASLLLLATTLTRFVGALLFGALASRFGRKPLLIASLAWCGVLTVLSGLAPTFAILLGIRLLYGMGVGGVYATAGALLREAAGRRGGLASGIFIFGWFGGSALSPLCFYKFLPVYGWRGVFVSEGIVLVLIPYLIFGLRESRVWLAERTALRAAAARARHLDAREVASSLRRLQSRPFWRIFAPGLLGTTLMLVCLEYGNFFSTSSGGLLPTFLKDAHFSVGQIALIGSVGSFAAMPGSLFGGWLCDAIGRRRTFVVLFGLIWIPVAVTFGFSSFPVVLVSWAVFGFFNGSTGGALAVFETEQYPTDLRSPGYGFAHNMGSIGGSFGASIAGFLAAAIHLGPALMAMTLFGVLLAMIAMAVAKETRGRSLLAAETEARAGAAASSEAGS
jgi:SHS family lactate transporter-like MFS transporter